MRISLVVAVAQNGVIGRDGGLAWKISDDLKRFKKLTIGHPVIMGRKTFESIGKPLPGRTNIVISRSMSNADGVIVARSVDEAMAAAQEAAHRGGVDEAFVIGGAEIYRLMLGRADRIHLTEVEASINGDVFMPQIDSTQWDRRLVGRADQSEKNEFNCNFFILDRVGASECGSEATDRAADGGKAQKRR